MRKRAVLYARVSGDDRGQEGRNLSGQLDMCRDYALNRNWNIITELAEDDRCASGASFELPKLNEALEMAKRGQFDVLVVRELDRFARKLAKQLIIENEFRRSSVNIEYVLGEYPDTPEGRLMKNVRATIAEYEREKIRERTSRARELKVKSGSVLIPKGQAPYGYKVVAKDNKSNLEIREDEARIIRMIFDWYTIGEVRGRTLSIGAIARKLTEMQVPTFADVRPNNRPKKRGYGKWGRSSVANILKNETYSGIWHYGKRRRISNENDTDNRRKTNKEDLLSVNVPALVSREVWEAAQARMTYNREHAIRNTKHKYLLRRRVTCGKCGLKMGGRAYVNTRGKSGGHCLYYCCPTNNPNLVVSVMHPISGQIMLILRFGHGLNPSY